eukprot:3503341-Lingulodinium_polyedra.AAC.2
MHNHVRLQIHTAYAASRVLPGTTNEYCMQVKRRRLSNVFAGTATPPQSSTSIFCVLKTPASSPYRPIGTVCSGSLRACRAGCLAYQSLPAERCQKSASTPGAPTKSAVNSSGNSERVANNSCGSRQPWAQVVSLMPSKVQGKSNSKISGRRGRQA